MAIGKRAAGSVISESRPTPLTAATARPPLPSGGAVSAGTLALIVAVTLLWGLNWPAMRAAVVELSPLTFRVVCVVVAGAGLLTIAAFGREPAWPRRAAWRPILLLALVNVTAWQMLSALALQRIGGGHGAIVAYTMPLWATLLSALWLKERISGRKLVALALGMAGMLALFGKDMGSLGETPLGTLYMLGAAFCWAVATVGTKAFDWRIGVVALSGWQLVLGGVPILLAWLWWEPSPDLSQLTWRGVLAAGYASTVALIFCFTAFTKIVTVLPASVAAVTTLAIPVVGVLSSAWLLGEPVGAGEIAALMLVLVALALALLPSRRAA
jgi:drug/metabolite transporter (DMT)-like permease